MPPSCRQLVWLAGVLLLGAEFGVLAAAVGAPRTSAMYREFYIARSRACWLPDPLAAQIADALRRPRIALASLTIDEKCYLLMQGWNGAAWGVWSADLTVAIDLPVPAGMTNAVLYLRAVQPDQPQTARISIGRQMLGTFSLPPGAGAHGFLFSARPPTRDMIITFQQTAGGAGRGIGLTEVDWTK